MSALEETVQQEQDEHDAAQATKGEDPDTGKLFEVPRVKVAVDDTDPTVLKINVTGSIEIDRANASDVDWYNSLAAGKNVSLPVDAFVAGAKKTHRRDSDGNVDAVVETKTIIIHSVDVEA